MKRATSLVVMCGAIAVPAIVVGGGFTQAIQKAGTTHELQVTGTCRRASRRHRRGAQHHVGRRHRHWVRDRLSLWNGPPERVEPELRSRRPIANSAIVKIGTGGKVCLYTADSDTQLIADVNGWFPANSGYTSTSPMRLLDTRPGLTTIDGVAASAGRRTSGDTTELQVTGRGRCTQQRRRRGAQRDICRSRRHRLRDRLSLWLVASERIEPQLRRRRTGRQLGDRQGRHRRQGVPVHADTDTQLIADINGYFPAGSGYTSTSPARVLDTRPGQTTVDGVSDGEGLRRAGQIYELQVRGRSRRARRRNRGGAQHHVRRSPRHRLRDGLAVR